MDFISLLAQAAQTSQEAAESIVPLDLIWQHITSLSKLEALTFISFGSVCLLYGWRVFKILVVISFAAIGLVLGMLLSEKIGDGNNPMLGLLVSIVMAIVSIPMMRWAVSILGAAAGGILTAGIWYACKLPEEYLWAGSLTGIVAGGMISFIVFKLAVMLFSSLSGSALVGAGVLALLYIYPQTTEQIHRLVFEEKWFLAVILAAPTLIGVLMQNKFVKDSPNWSV